MVQHWNPLDSLCVWRGTHFTASVTTANGKKKLETLVPSFSKWDGKVDSHGFRILTNQTLNLDFQAQEVVVRILRDCILFETGMQYFDFCMFVMLKCHLTAPCTWHVCGKELVCSASGEVCCCWKPWSNTWWKNLKAGTSFLDGWIGRSISTVNWRL